MGCCWSSISLQKVLFGTMPDQRECWREIVTITAIYEAVISERGCLPWHWNTVFYHIRYILDSSILMFLKENEHFQNLSKLVISQHICNSFKPRYSISGYTMPRWLLMQTYFKFGLRDIRTILCYKIVSRWICICRESCLQCDFVTYNDLGAMS